MVRRMCIGLLGFAVLAPPALASQPRTAPQPQAKPAIPPESLLENPFQPGAMLVDTNGDSIPDAVCGHILVPAEASEAENAAAANLTARLGYETTAMTLPLVVAGAHPAPEPGCKAATDIWIGDALPPAERAALAPMLDGLGLGEGGVFLVPGGLAIEARDGIGLLGTANALASRAPYLWSVPGPKLATLAQSVDDAFAKAKLAATAQLVGFSIADREPGLRTAFFRVAGAADATAVDKALKPEAPAASFHLTGVREAQLLVGAIPVALAGSPSSAPTALPASSPGAAEGPPRRLDLGQLYSIKGLLTGNAKMPVPSGVASHLYVPAGPRGTAMANLAGRMGLETTGITLPLAEPLSGNMPSQVKMDAVLSGPGSLTGHTESVLAAPGNADLDKLGNLAPAAPAPELPALRPGEGEARIADGAFGKQGALLIRGDDAGASEATAYMAEHLPNLWQTGKRYASVEEVRDDLRHFFSLRSGVGQTAVSLYHLDGWLDELAKTESGKTLDSVTAEVDADEIDPGVKALIEHEIASRVHATHVEVKLASLHAGLKCCAADPPLARSSDVVAFHPAKPTIEEDLVIPWEGTRLLDAVRGGAGRVAATDDVSLEARVSEDPEERRKLAAQATELLVKAGAAPDRVHVEVLCAYKQGYSWLLDSVAPQLKGKPVDHIQIEFAPYTDKEKLTSMWSKSRWVQELYPADEMLARQLNLPLARIAFSEFHGSAPAKTTSEAGPTYRVHAFAADGHELLRQDFTVALAERPYSNEFANYDHVHVETGWVKLEVHGQTRLDQRIETDPEMFWDHYETKTLPAIYRYILAQNDGKPKVEYQPLFDTIRVSFHMSEPDYNLGLDQERISSLEALQEDTLFSTQNFFYMFGNLEATGMMDYMGRVIPVAYPSADGQDGHVRIEFYAKDAPHPRVRLAWRETASGPEQQRCRDLPVVHTDDPRLVAARVRAGVPGVESLTWSLPVAAREDKFDQWRLLAPQEQLEHTALFAAQAQGQIDWLNRMHAAGLFKNELAYPDLRALQFEFTLPLGFDPPKQTKPAVVTATLQVAPPAEARPQIASIPPAPLDATGHFVQWKHPIGPEESARLLSRLSTYPGVDVYWMGRTYLGQNIWAADILLPSRSALRSMAKETTLKAAIIYSGRQHANEVSSTSHIFRLAEQLVLDPATRASLNKVNVVVHPITNVDGAALAMDLAKITPNNMLHPGYHASLTADLVTAQWDKDPLYPESRTRRQLWEAWLPDAFLNPHGYPSHEWVEPFSEYAAWVITRTQADSGRAWWIPRGWFTSLNYLSDPDHPQSETVTLALRDYIAANMGKTPGVLDMNARMNARYFRYGQQWDQLDFQQPIYKGVRIYMAQVGTAPDPKAQSFLSRFPDVTYDDGYTEAPDETAYGDWLHLVASAGLAYDRAHLQYLTDAKRKIDRKEKEYFDGVNWKVSRERPMLPPEIDQLDHTK